MSGRKGRGSLVARPDKGDRFGGKLDRVPASAQDLAALRTAVGGRVRVPRSERGNGGRQAQTRNVHAVPSGERSPMQEAYSLSKIM